MQYTIRRGKLVDIELLDSIHTENMQSYVERNYAWMIYLIPIKNSINIY